MRATIIILFIFITLVLSSCTITVSPKVACESYHGKWIEEARECEGITQEQCTIFQGNFNACASACRNKNNTVCTAQCVPVCSLV